jgi:integrase
MIDGKRIERRTDAKTRKEAIAICNDLEASAAKGGLTAESFTIRVNELYDALCTDYRVTGKRVSDLAKRWKHLEPVFGRDRARDVTTPRIRNYIAARLEEKAAPATIQLELACLRRMMRLGVQDRRLSYVPSFPKITVENARSGFMDHETFQKLKAELPEPTSTMAVLGFEIGWRFSEIAGLKWNQIDLEEGTVRLKAGTTKNKKARLTYLTAPALAAMKAWREQTKTFERENNRIVPHVFHRYGEPVRSIYTAWRSACERVGHPDFLFHDLRRCAARNYTRAGVQESVAMKAMGHLTRHIFDRYNICAEADLKDAASKVSRLTDGANLGQAAAATQKTADEKTVTS